MKVRSLNKVSEVSIPTTQVQEVTLIQVTPLTEVTSSLVNSCSKVISEFTFFWNPEELSKVTSKGESQVEELTAPVPNSIIVTPNTSLQVTPPTSCLKVASCHKKMKIPKESHL